MSYHSLRSFNPIGRRTRDAVHLLTNARTRGILRVWSGTRLSVAPAAWDIREREAMPQENVARTSSWSNNCSAFALLPYSSELPWRRLDMPPLMHVQALNNLKPLTNFKCIGFGPSRRGSLAVADSPCRHDGQHVRANAPQSRE
jgi:hypothetical protein